MRITQFTLLQALVLAKNISQGNLAELLGMDSTTLTRTLTLLRKKGWVNAERGKDRRQVRLTLSSEGRGEFRRAVPCWVSAQRRLRTALGETNWKLIAKATMSIAAIGRGH